MQLYPAILPNTHEHTGDLGLISATVATLTNTAEHSRTFESYLCHIVELDGFRPFRRLYKAFVCRAFDLFRRLWTALDGFGRLGRLWTARTHLNNSEQFRTIPGNFEHM